MLYSIAISLAVTVAIVISCIWLQKILLWLVQEEDKHVERELIDVPINLSSPAAWGVLSGMRAGLCLTKKQVKHVMDGR